MNNTSSIKDLINALRPLVDEFAVKIANCDNRMGDELMDEYDSYIGAVHQIAAAWVGKPDHERTHKVDFCEDTGSRYLTVNFSGAMGYSESIYISATIYTNDDQDVEVESVSQQRLSCHQGQR